MYKGITKSKGNKHELDKFYTKDEVAKRLIGLLDLDSYDAIIEPSAGGGAFSRHLVKYNLYAYDISPESPEVIELDWFDLDTQYFNDKYKNVLVVGNPPFGVGGSLAIDFIKQATKVADTIAFILPKSFMKDTLMNKIPLNYWLKEDVVGSRGLELEDRIFTLNGEGYGVPCVFQIWEKREELREQVVYRTTSKYIEFVGKDEADFRVQRVGGNAGKASKKMDVSEQSNYFIRLKDECVFSVDEMIGLINGLEYPTVMYTVGPKSLSKGELIKVMEDGIEVIQNKQERIA